MPITLNDNLGINAPKPTDNRYGYYASLPNALSALDVTVRYIDRKSTRLNSSHT